jgi:hypothetical protein
VTLDEARSRVELVSYGGEMPHSDVSSRTTIKRALPDTVLSCLALSMAGVEKKTDVPLFKVTTLSGFDDDVQPLDVQSLHER